MEFVPIGFIRSSFKTKEACPIQPSFAENSFGSVEVLPKFAPGLQDIEQFSHIYLLYQFDRPGDIKLVRQTFLDDRPHGIYASRHPCRPNGIGLSIVQLTARQDNVLSVRGVDVLDGTPLLDIKPYVPRFDAFAHASEGWVAETKWRPKPEGRE